MHIDAWYRSKPWIEGLNQKEMLEYCKQYAEIFKPYVCDEWVSKLSTALKEDKKIVDDI